MRACNKCGAVHPLTHYRISNKNTGRRETLCKQCKRDASKAWHQRQHRNRTPGPLTPDELIAIEEPPAALQRDKTDDYFVDEWAALCEHCALRDCIRAEGIIQPNGGKATYRGCHIWEYSRAGVDPATALAEIEQKEAANEPQITRRRGYPEPRQQYRIATGF